ncbi:MAG: biopolymer transporter ExbD [Planctomycetota bacterium]
MTAHAGQRRRRRGFRRRDARATYDLHFGPNMTPMVDVVLVILIFFMASAAFLGPELLLRSGLPGVGEELSPLDALERRQDTSDVFDLDPPTLVIRVRPSDAAVVCDAFGRTSLSADELRTVADQVADELRATGALRGDPNTDVAVSIEIAPGIAYGDAVGVHDIVTGAGFIRVGMR